MRPWHSSSMLRRQQARRAAQLLASHQALKLQPPMENSGVSAASVCARTHTTSTRKSDEAEGVPGHSHRAYITALQKKRVRIQCLRPLPTLRQAATQPAARSGQHWQRRQHHAAAVAADRARHPAAQARTASSSCSSGAAVSGLCHGPASSRWQQWQGACLAQQGSTGRSGACVFSAQPDGSWQAAHRPAPGL